MSGISAGTIKNFYLKRFSFFFKKPCRRHGPRSDCRLVASWHSSLKRLIPFTATMSFNNNYLAKTKQQLEQVI